jgi:hypothetical protein
MEIYPRNEIAKQQRAAHVTDVVKRSYHLMIDGKAVCGEQHVWQVWFDYITSLPEASSLLIALSGQAAAYVSEPISLSQGR